MIANSGFVRLAWFATALAFCVIVFGAFVRLSNAGLSCPDWPTCYGQVTWPAHVQEIASANRDYPDRPVATDKAWREQVHRLLAGTLVLATFVLAGWSARRRALLGTAWTVPLIASVVIVFQALLGMWTVTWKLKPIVVMAHLLGGLMTFALLGYVALRLTVVSCGSVETAKLRRMILVGIGLLVLQIALGGWTSANYAAFACGTDFPKCLDQWWPAADFREAFVLWRGIGVNYEGGVLDGSARIAIQLAHRIGALLVFGHLFAVAMIARKRGLRIEGGLLALALGVQIVLGISNVHFALPLAIATAHSAMAALLLFLLLLLVLRTGRVGRLPR
jgi:heme a synthase